MIKILIDEKTQKVFWFLWKNRKEPYTIRETALKADVSYGSTWSILKEFEELGIVYGFEKKIAYLYILNFENPLVFQLWSLLNALKRKNVRVEVKETKGFAIYYRTNDVSKTLYCSEKQIRDVEFIHPQKLREVLRTREEFFDTLWNEGIVLWGERQFYTFMWEIAEKKVIGVGP